MECIEEIREQQRLAERAAAAPYVDYPPTPLWYMPLMGLWAFAAVVVLTRPNTSSAFRLVGELGLLSTIHALVWWHRRIRGVWPTGRAPREIRRVMLAFVIGVLVVIGIVLGARVLTNVWIAAGVAFVIATAGVAWYDRAYAKASDRVRERLA